MSTDKDAVRLAFHIIQHNFGPLVGVRVFPEEEDRSPARRSPVPEPCSAAAGAAAAPRRPRANPLRPFPFAFPTSQKVAQPLLHRGQLTLAQIHKLSLLPPSAAPLLRAALLLLAQHNLLYLTPSSTAGNDAYEVNTRAVFDLERVGRAVEGARAKWGDQAAEVVELLAGKGKASLADVLEGLGGTAAAGGGAAGGKVETREVTEEVEEEVTDDDADDADDTDSGSDDAEGSASDDDGGSDASSSGSSGSGRRSKRSKSSASSSKGRKPPRLPTKRGSRSKRSSTKEDDSDASKASDDDDDDDEYASDGSGANRKRKRATTSSAKSSSASRSKKSKKDNRKAKVSSKGSKGSKGKGGKGKQRKTVKRMVTRTVIVGGQGMDKKRLSFSPPPPSSLLLTLCAAPGLSLKLTHPLPPIRRRLDRADAPSPSPDILHPPRPPGPPHFAQLPPLLAPSRRACQAPRCRRPQGPERGVCPSERQDRGAAR